MSARPAEPPTPRPNCSQRFCARPKRARSAHLGRSCRSPISTLTQRSCQDPPRSRRVLQGGRGRNHGQGQAGIRSEGEGQGSEEGRSQTGNQGRQEGCRCVALTHDKFHRGASNTGSAFFVPGARLPALIRAPALAGAHLSPTRRAEARRATERLNGIPESTPDADSLDLGFDTWRYCAR